MTDPRAKVRWGFPSDEERTEFADLLISIGAEDVAVEQIPPVGNGVGIHLPIEVYDAALLSFFTAFAAKAGSDTWDGVRLTLSKLKEWFNGKYPTSGPPHDRLTISLRWPETETVIWLESELPNEAYQALMDLALEPGANYEWNYDERTWEG